MIQDAFTDVLQSRRRGGAGVGGREEMGGGQYPSREREPGYERGYERGYPRGYEQRESWGAGPRRERESGYEGYGRERGGGGGYARERESGYEGYGREREREGGYGRERGFEREREQPERPSSMWSAAEGDTIGARGKQELERGVSSRGMPRGAGGPGSIAGGSVAGGAGEDIGRGGGQEEVSLRGTEDIASVSNLGTAGRDELERKYSLSGAPERGPTTSGPGAGASSGMGGASREMGPYSEESRRGAAVGGTSGPYKYYEEEGRGEAPYRQREREGPSYRRERPYEEMGPTTTSPRGFMGQISTAVSSGMTEERTSHLIQRFKRLFAQMARHPDFQDSMAYLVKLLGSVQETGMFYGGTSRNMFRDPNAMAASQDLKTLIERFAQNKSLDSMFDAFSVFQQHIQKDYELRDYMVEFTEYLTRSIRAPSFIEHPDWERKGSQLLERGRDIFYQNYRPDTQRLMSELNDFTEAMRTDPLTKELVASVRDITNDLMMDAQGNYQLKTQLLRDVATVFLPMLFSSIKYVPIPRIEHEDDNYHLIVEDIVLSSQNFLPNLMELKMKNAALIGLRKGVESATGHSVTMNFFHIQSRIQDVPFYFRKKHGFPRISDYGVADLLIGGQGISVLLKLGIDQYSPTRTLVPRRVMCTVDNLKLQIHGSQRDSLYKMFGGVMSTQIKAQIQRSVETTLLNLIDRVDETLTRLKLEYLQPVVAPPTSREEVAELFLGGGAGVSKRFTEAMKRRKEGPPGYKERKYQYEYGTRLPPWYSRKFGEATGMVPISKGYGKGASGTRRRRTGWEGIGGEGGASTERGAYGEGGASGERGAYGEQEEEEYYGYEGGQGQQRQQSSGMSMGQEPGIQSQQPQKQQQTPSRSKSGFFNLGRFGRSSSRV